MTTQSEEAAALTAITKQLKKSQEEVQALQLEHRTLWTNLSDGQTALAAANQAKTAAEDALLAATQTNNTLLAKVAELEAQLAAQDNVSPEVEAATAALKIQAQANDDLIVDAPPPPPPTPTVDDAAILAELTDFTLAGVSKRLGPDYASFHPVRGDFPTLYQPPSKPATQGIGGRPWQLAGPETEGGGDFASTDAQVLVTGDALPQANGVPVGVDNVRIYEMSNGAMREAPFPPWNARFEPDSAADGWTASYGMGDKLGFPVAVARGHGRDANCGLIAFSSGYIATAGTVTAFSPWSGALLPANKKPLCIAVTSSNEFGLVGVHDVDTGLGEVAVISLWGGYAEGNTDGTIPLIYAGWKRPYPGAPNIGQFTGMKILGYVALPFKFPTGISVVTERPQGRVEQDDGNAGNLGAFDLNLQADRDLFATGRNAAIFATWGEAVVIAKYEDLAAHLDLTALFVKMRKAYTTTQEEFDKTKPLNANPWWAAFSQEDQGWPQGFVTDPTIKPVVTAKINVTRPTAVLLSEHGDAAVAIAREDGTVTLYDKGLLSVQATVNVGRNPTCLTYDKYTFDAQGHVLGNIGIRYGGFLAVSRGENELVWVSGWDAAARITQRASDARILDMVSAEVADTHGIQTGLVTVCDFAGKQVVNLRYTELVLATSTGEHIGMGPAGADLLEFGGALAIKGSPFGISGSNVN